MIKIITLLTKFILIVLTAILFSSCNQSGNWNAIEGSGNITTEKRNISGNFTNVEVNNGIDLVIEQSETTEVTVETDDNLQEYITTAVENGTLIISFDKNSFIDLSTKKVRVKMPTIEELEATSSSNISSKNIILGENIRLHSSSGGTIRVDLEADIITCGSSSGSNILISGKALELKTTASSGSDIKARNLLANLVSADVSSGASINVHPIINLTAQASSGGNITYVVEPKTIDKNVSSGGSVNKG
ncbi:hypothetical protein RCH18_002814 [Flavobacterium sp. PL11]|jgi:hypothetical protein|uniref:head GIN domain-containing protein n=1 Tax=Flavobacterium sp. PL11 TaxID=3071717 RepID=UPI002E0CCE64|nr:hypothetical protein [Flavobacterium sp. PL11]